MYINAAERSLGYHWNDRASQPADYLSNWCAGTQSRHHVYCTHCLQIKNWLLVIPHAAVIWLKV